MHPWNRDRSARSARAIALTFASVVFLRTLFADPVPPPGLELRVKAAFVYNFAKFVEWPPGAFAPANAPLTVCALASEPFTVELERAVQGKRMAHRGLLLRRLSDDEAPDGCHVLVVEPVDAKRIAALLAKVRLRPVLTVGQHRDFAQLGGVVNFTRQGDRIRFQINVDAAARAGLSISSKLLSVAQVMHDKPPAEDRK